MKKNISLIGKMNKKKKRRIAGRFLKGTAALIGTALLFGMTLIYTHDTALADGADDEGTAYGMKIQLLEWNRVYEVFRKDSYGCFVWPNGNTYYFSGGRDLGGKKNADGRWDYWVGKPSTIDPYLDFPKDRFITRKDHDIPYFYYAGDNGSYLANSAKFQINIKPYLDYASTTNWLRTPSNNLIGSDKATTFSILDYKHDNKGSSTKNMHKAATLTAKGYVRVMSYYGEEKCTDMYYSGDYLSVHKKDDWPHTDIMMYEVKKVNYEAMSDYVITSGQIFNSRDDSFLLDNKTLTIQEDGVLSVKGTFFYNGTIDCAGTIILQEGAIMMPYNPNKKAGEIKLHDGGTIIIMPGARLLAGIPKPIMNTTEDGWFESKNGNIINYGLLVACCVEFYKDTTIEMHDGSMAFLGYYPKNTNLNGWLGKYAVLNTSVMDLGLNAYNHAIGIYNPSIHLMGDSEVVISNTVDYEMQKYYDVTTANGIETKHQSVKSEKLLIHIRYRNTKSQLQAQ